MMKKQTLLKAKAQVSSAVVTEHGGVAAVDWKGRLYLGDGGAVTIVEGAHSDRAQGVTVLDDGRVVSAGWDAVRMFGPRGDALGEWGGGRRGKGFQRFWSVRRRGARVAFDYQNGASAELYLGAVGADGLELDEAPARTAKTDGRAPVRIAAVTDDAVIWWSPKAVLRVPFEAGAVKTLAKVPESARSVAYGERGLVYAAEQALVLPDARVALPQTDDLYPLAAGPDAVAVKMGADQIHVYGWDGSLLDEGSHRQCCGLSWMPDGRLLSWGWDKQVRAWTRSGR